MISRSRFILCDRSILKNKTILDIGNTTEFLSSGDKFFRTGYQCEEFLLLNQKLRMYLTDPFEPSKFQG